jgi:hypothetical protein
MFFIFVQVLTMTLQKTNIMKVANFKIGDKIKFTCQFFGSIKLTTVIHVYETSIVTKSESGFQDVFNDFKIKKLNVQIA